MTTNLRDIETNDRWLVDESNNVIGVQLQGNSNASTNFLTATTNPVTGGIVISAAGNPILIPEVGTGKLRAVVFGNSIAKLNAVYPLSSVTTTLSVAGAVGDTDLSVASNASFTVADTVQIVCYDGSLYEGVISAKPTGKITVSPALTKAVPTAETVAKKNATTWAMRYASNSHWRIINAMCQGAFDIRNCYGYGGALSTQMAGDFSSAVLAYHPKYCFFQLFENDVLAIGGTSVNGETKTIQQIKDQTASYISQCLTDGITPVFSTPLPSYGFNTTALVNAYDALLAYTLSLPALYPGTIVLPLHLAYIDQNPALTARQPQGTQTYTDATAHPNALGSQVLATFGAPLLKKALPILQGYTPVWPAGSVVVGNYASNATMSGSGGTVNAPITGSCPTSTNCAATVTGLSANTEVSSLIADGLQQAWKIATSHTGADLVANNTTARLLPITCAAGTMVIGRAEIELQNVTNLHGYSLVIDFGNGQQARSIEWNTTDADIGSTVPSGKFVLETTPIAAPAAGAGTARLYLAVQPKAGALTFTADQIWYKASIEPYV